MQPANLIPAADAIPVGWGWFQGLLTLTWVLHIVLMNMMLGGSIIALFNSIKGRQINLDIAKSISHIIPFAVALAVNAGVAPFLFLQVIYGHFVYVSSILMAVYWLSIVLMLILAYYGVYLYRYKFDSWGGGRTLILGFSTVLLLLIGFLFTNNWTLALTPEKWVAYFSNPSGTVLNLSEPTLWPRYLHMVFGAIAVAGLSLAAFGWRKPDSDPLKSLLVPHGLAWFKWTTAVQVLIGSWWLMALRPDVMKLFMGGNMVATAAFATGFVLALVALVLGFKGKVWPTVWTTLIVMIVMAVMREYVRHGYLREYFSPTQLEVKSQYSPFIFFLVILVLGIGAVWYMLKLATNAGKEV